VRETAGRAEDMRAATSAKNHTHLREKELWRAARKGSQGGDERRGKTRSKGECWILTPPSIRKRGGEADLGATCSGEEAARGGVGLNRMKCGL